MRTQQWKIAAIVLAVVAGGAAYAWADVAATVNVNTQGFSPLITNSGTPWNTDYRVYGWRFFVTKPMVITHLGVFGAHRNYQSQIVDDGLNSTHQMGIWGIRRASAGGGYQLLRGPIPIGPGGTVEGHYVYVPLDEPLMMTPTDPTYDRLIIGVWTGQNNTDLFYHGPISAQTLTVQQQALAIQMQNYTFYWKNNNGTVIENSTTFDAPLGSTLDSYHYYALNFKYNLVGASAEAGVDVSIHTSEQAGTVIHGVGTNVSPNTPMQYRWLEAGNVLQDWADVAADAAANLSLASVPAFSVGTHTLTLEVKDAATTASDTMTLTVVNTPPEVDAGESVSVYTVELIDTVIQGSATDVDGDELTYRWLEGATELSASYPVEPNGPVLWFRGVGSVPAIGSHTLTLEVTDAKGAVCTDTMVLTVLNTPPKAQPSPASLTVEVGGPIELTGEVWDFDGDTLSYQWVKGGEVLASGTVDTTRGGSWGSPTPVGELVTPADQRFVLGDNIIELIVTDGDPQHEPFSASVIVTVQDTTAPVIAPKSSTTMLWPPDHTLRPVTIQANAADKSGGAVVLAVVVQSNEPANDGGDGSTDVDWYIDPVDNATGAIALQLRAERAGGGAGRVYTVTITATDESGNISSAAVQVCVPHDSRKR